MRIVASPKKAESDRGEASGRLSVRRGRGRASVNAAAKPEAEGIAMQAEQ